MDRSTIVAAQRDALWVIALRTKLLRAQSDQQLTAARRLAADARDTVARAQALERLYRSGGGARRRRTVVSLARWANARRA